MSNIQVRHTVQSLFSLKLELLDNMKKLKALDKQIRDNFQEINGYSPYRIDCNFRVWSENVDEKAIDQALWYYLARLNNLEKYMLCTDHEKMMKEIEECRTPDFTIENADGWIAGLQGLIRENVKTLVQDVYSRIVNGVYYTGGRNGDKKKRNNNGIDKMFILRTGDYNSIFSYYSSRPSIMDDLEKVCYLLDGKVLPEKTIRGQFRDSKNAEYTDEYMTVKLCANGNTHFKLADKTRAALNKYGPTGATLGENIKIKIFTDRW